MCLGEKNELWKKRIAWLTPIKALRNRTTDPKKEMGIFDLPQDIRTQNAQNRTDKIFGYIGNKLETMKSVPKWTRREKGKTKKMRWFLNSS